MSWVAAAIGGGALIGAGASIFASNKQSDASANALAQQNQIYKKGQADLAPYKNVGSGALMTLGQLYGIGADGKPTGQPYSPAALEAFYKSPDYQVAFDQGNKALTFSNAAKGLLQSGANLKDIVGFGQGLATKTFGDYVNRLSGLATMGQNSAAGGATNGLAFANLAGNTTMAGGQAAASGAVGAANALTGGVGSYINYNQQQANNQNLVDAIKSNKVGGNNAVGSIPPTDYAGGGPLGYADGGRPPVGRPIMVGDQPNRGSWGGGWQGSPGWDGGQPGQPGIPQNGLANAWANMSGGGFRGGQFGQPNGLATAMQSYGRPMMGGFPGFADGGRPPTGQPAIVGEPYNDEPRPELFVPDRGPPQIVGANGPEIISTNQPGTVIPNHELPLWLESGMEDAPPYHPPMNRAVDDYSSRDPNELATMRHQGMVRPQAGRGDFTPEHLANMALTAGGVAVAPYALPALSYLSPEALAAHVATRAPALAAGGLGAVYAASPTTAGEQEFKWADQDTARTKEMADIQNRINGRAAQITTLGTTKTNSPAGTQASTIKSLEALNHPEGADMKRLTELRQQAAKDRDTAFEQWQYDQERDRQQAEAKRKSEQSLFDVIPGTRSAIAVGAPAAAGLGGYFLGRKFGPLGGTIAGGIMGGAEGAASMIVPTEVDYRLPRTSPSQQEAAGDMADPNYWRRVAIVTGMNSLLGGIGGFKGAMSRRSIMPMSGPPNTPPGQPPATALPPSTPVGPQNSLAIASQQPPLPLSPAPTNALAAASVMVVKDKNGRTIYMNRGGGFAKKEDIERYLNSKASP